MTTRRRSLSTAAAAILVGAGALALWTGVARTLSARRRHAATAARERAMDEAADRLRAFDRERRQAADFERLPTWDRRSGPDPYLLQELPGARQLVGILRGADAVVVLDERLHEIQRLPAPRAPVALAASGDWVYVAGEMAPEIARYRWDGRALTASGSAAPAGVRAIRGLAAGEGGWLYAVEEQRGRLIALEIAAPDGGSHRGRDGDGAFAFARRKDLPVGNGPVRLARVGDRLIADCLLDRALVVLRLEPGGRPADEAPIRIVHDGPLWSFAAMPDGAGALILAAGGVEDHPLDRTVGAFGYVDSFVYLYRVDLDARRAVRAAAVDVSAEGVVVPKALALAGTAARPVVRVAGYGSDRLLELRWDGAAPPAISARRLVPGTNAVVARADGALAFADPLLDAWVLAAPGGGDAQVVPVRSSSPPVDADPDTADVRLGEALVFTTLMAPWNRSDGPLSRFTCETCHFEGYGDGRTHHTGRGDVHAVTKPLLGLFNNRPHFSRALDPDLMTVAFNEFRVAGLRSDHDPWFSLRAEDAPWLAAMGVREDQLTPEGLRRAFMAFLMAFNHRPNPAALGRDRFSAVERAGAAVFRDRCESCHEARLASDLPGSRVPFERWEELILAHDGPIVWGKNVYEKTGVVPYVHELGARVPSLRRLYKKRPYFTNGSAPDLASVLARARYTHSQFWHEGADGSPGAAPRALGDGEQRALLAFLDLL